MLAMDGKNRDAVRGQLVKITFCRRSRLRSCRPLLRKAYLQDAGHEPGLLFNSGSEANEKAFKMVRQISAQHHGGKKSKILYRDRDYRYHYHRFSAAGQKQRQAYYGPFTPGFVCVPHCLEYRNQYDTAENYGERAADAIEDVILQEGRTRSVASILRPSPLEGINTAERLLGTGAGIFPNTVSF